MINGIVKKLTAAALAAAVLIGSASVSPSGGIGVYTAHADYLSDKMDEASLGVTQKFLDTFSDSGVKAELPDSRSFLGKTYEAGRETSKSIGLSKGLEFTERGIYFLKKGVTKGLNYIGRKGIEKYGIYENMKRPFSHRKGGMTRAHSQWKHGRYNLKTAKKLAGMEATPFSFGKTIGNGVNIGVAIYGFKQMADNPTIGFRSPFLEFTGNMMRGIGNTATFASGIMDYLPVPKTWKASIEGMADVFLIGDILHNNAVTVDLSNQVYDYLHDLNEKNGRKGPLSYLLAVTDFADDVVNLGDLTLQEGINNAVDWFDYWIYGIEGDENERYLEELKRRCKGNTFQGKGVGVYKPNIYLYPTDETEISVTFDYPELLTVSDPPYENGWSAVASPDGTLSANGREYGYLFYESLTDPLDYQTEKGYLIPADDRQEIFTEILTAYGLNETEIADFNEFWCKKLDDGCDYAMYPQLDDILGVTMPLNVSPAPDSIGRIWFAFEKNASPERKAIPIEFEREGFTVIEWGGFFIDRT